MSTTYPCCAVKEWVGQAERPHLFPYFAMWAIYWVYFSYLFNSAQSRSPKNPVVLASCANPVAPIRSLAANFQANPYRLGLEQEGQFDAVAHSR
jgi:hypothetical protein